MKSHILVPLDGSALAETALPHAVALARATGSMMALVRVIGRPLRIEPTAWPMGMTTRRSGSFEDEKEQARTYLDRVAAHLYTSGVTIHTAVLEGDPASQILDRAEWFASTSLIVMASHGRSGVQRLIVGSVAEKVLRTAPRPVLLIPATSQARPAAYNRLLVPLDSSTFAEQALDASLPLASAMGATILLVSVVAGTPTQVDETSDAALGESGVLPLWVLAERHAEICHHRCYLAATQQRLADAGVTSETKLVYGKPAAAILAVASEEHADLLVLATHGRSGLRRVWLGSVAQEILHATDRPVLLIGPRALAHAGVDREAHVPASFLS